jgi:hypothetical protein
MRTIISFIIAFGLACSAGAQDTTDKPLQSTTTGKATQYKDPQRALVLGSLIPGAGHIYAGEYWRGIGAYEATVSSIGMGAMVFIVDNCTFTFLSTKSCKPEPAWPHQAVGVALVGVGLWKWISTARDAPHAAERANARHAARSQTVTPIVNPTGGPSNATQVGVSVHW